MYTNDHFIFPLFQRNRISLDPLANPLTLLFKRDGRPVSGYKDPPPTTTVWTRQSYELLYSPWEQRTSICVEVVLLLRHRRERCQCHRSVVSALNGAGASVRAATFLCKRLPSVRFALCRRFYGTPSTPGKQETRSTEHIVSPNYCDTLYGRFCHKILGDTLARLL